MISHFCGALTNLCRVNSQFHRLLFFVCLWLRASPGSMREMLSSAHPADANFAVCCPPNERLLIKSFGTEKVSLRVSLNWKQKNNCCLVLKRRRKESKKEGFCGVSLELISNKSNWVFWSLSLKNANYRTPTLVCIIEIILTVFPLSACPLFLITFF